MHIRLPLRNGILRTILAPLWYAAGIPQSRVLSNGDLDGWPIGLTRHACRTSNEGRFVALWDLAAVGCVPLPQIRPKRLFQCCRVAVCRSALHRDKTFVRYGVCRTTETQPVGGRPGPFLRGNRIKWGMVKGKQKQGDRATADPGGPATAAAG